MKDKRVVRNFVDGKHCDAADGRSADLVDPSTGAVFGSAPLSGAADVDAVMAVAAAAFEKWRDTTPGERQRALLRIADAVEGRVADLVAAECENTGKPIGLTTSEEIPLVVDPIRFFAGAAPLLEGRSAGEYLAGHTSFVRREPVGVCAQVTPWNYPMMMAALKFAPALAAGNTVVLKPSDTTPVTTVLLAEIAAEFLPPGVLNVVCGDRDTGRELVAHPTPRMVSVTGSVRAGMEVAQAAAKDLKRVHLELGGKAPVIVFDDADVEKAAAAIAVAGYFNAGQDCTGATRVLAEPGVHDDFVAVLTEQARNTKTGAPEEEGVLYGPLNNPNELERVARIVGRLPDHAEVRTGGRQVGERGFFYAPTGLRAAPGRRGEPERDLRPGHHRPGLRRRGRGRALGQRGALRVGLQRVDPRRRAGDAGGPAAGLRLRMDQHPQPVCGRNAAWRLQALRLRQGPVHLRAGGLHPRQTRH